MKHGKQGRGARRKAKSLKRRKQVSSLTMRKLHLHKPQPDIVAALRKRPSKLSRQAADLIERLRADIALLRRRNKISDKIMAGLRRARREQKQLGGRNAASARYEAEALARAQALAPIMAELQALSDRAAAIELNRRGIKTSTGCGWHGATVQRVRLRIARPAP
jgi:hypothetical protein